MCQKKNKASVRGAWTSAFRALGANQRLSTSVTHSRWNFAYQPLPVTERDHHSMSHKIKKEFQPQKLMAFFTLPARGRTQDGTATPALHSDDSFTDIPDAASPAIDAQGLANAFSLSPKALPVSSSPAKPRVPLDPDLLESEMSPHHDTTLLQTSLQSSIAAFPTTNWYSIPQ